MWNGRPMIDAHCHLDLYPHPNGVVREAVKHGVFVVSVTTTPLAWKDTSRLAYGHDSIVTALGMHPQLVASRPGDMEHFEDLVSETEWLGEIGLDGSSECKGSMPEQVRVFRHVLTVSARAGGRMMSIHSRGASEAVIAELRAAPDAGIPILHWFSGTLRQLESAVMMGCWFSVGEPMLRSKRGQDLIRRIPKERMLTESDGPFVQIRGKPAYPWNMDGVERQLAELWRESAEDARTRLWENFRRLQHKLR